MTYRWYHEVSAEWLRARRTVLTATDVAGLMPEYKRYLKAGDPDKIMPGFAALWCQKHSSSEPDPSSIGPAARGHIMEPWAVQSWNSQVPDEKYNHWDNCIICRNVFGFSPDAMNIAQPKELAKVQVALDGSILVDAVENKLYSNAPTEIMEIKCYEPAKHMKSVIKGKMEHDELMQIAMAFVVLPKLQYARLLWFCPDSPFSMHTEVYTSDDLHDHIRWILEIGEVYMKQAALCEKIVSSGLTAQCTEREVYEDYIAEKETSLNSIFLLKG